MSTHWKCSSCCLSNSQQNTNCQACFTPHGAVVDDHDAEDVLNCATCKQDLNAEAFRAAQLKKRKPRCNACIKKVIQDQWASKKKVVHSEAVGANQDALAAPKNSFRSNLTMIDDQHDTVDTFQDSLCIMVLCATCKQDLNAEAFRAAQLKRRKPRCNGCIKKFIQKMRAPKKKVVTTLTMIDDLLDTFEKPPFGKLTSFTIHTLQTVVSMQPRHIWQIFSDQISSDYPLQTRHRRKMSDFLGGKGCLAPVFEPGHRATLQTIALVDSVYGARPLRPRSMTNLKNWISHELCCLAFSTVIKALYPEMTQKFDAQCWRRNKAKGGGGGTTRSDIFVPGLLTHIEIKTDVWSGNCKNQHREFRSATYAVYCIKFKYGTSRVTMSRRGKKDWCVQSWLEMISNTCVLPVFLRWAEYIVHHSSLVKKKREQHAQGDKVYTMAVWPSVDHQKRFCYLD